MWTSTYMQDMREIPAIVNEKIVIVLKFSHFWWGYLPCNGSSKQTNRQKVSFKKKQHVSRPCSFGEEVVHADMDSKQTNRQEVSLKTKQHVSRPCSFGEVVHTDMDTHTTK